MVDSIQSSKFITEKKSTELIKKLTNMASVYEAAQLRRQVVVHGRVKTMNESIYYFVDDIHRAIAENKKISFEYMKWNEEKKLVRRKDTLYVVSPWALTWDDENYYLIAYDDAAERIKHFRVDKLKSIQVLEDRRTGKDAFKAFDMARYAKMSFGMFGGKPTKVRISFENDLVGVFIDRFGRDIPIYSTDREGWSETSVEVAMSDQFLGWIFALGSKVKILGPKEVVARFKDELAAMKQLYDQA